MSAVWPDHLLSMADWDALPEDDSRWFEVAEGVMRVAPRPVTVRVPDLVVVPMKVARTNPARFAAADVVLVIEIVSPGSVRLDNVVKLDEYAETGIEQYWIVDLEDPVTVTVYQLVDGSYQPCDEATETLRVETPIPLTVDVTALTP